MKTAQWRVSGFSSGIALGLALSLGPVGAAVILVPDPPAFDAVSGLYRYSYTVDNTAGSFDIESWQLVFEFATPDWVQFDAGSDPAGQVEAPAGWIATPSFSTPGGVSGQDFLLASGAPVLAGEQLAGFSFQSYLPPGLVQYWEFGGVDSSSSFVLGPTGVPEPGPGGWVVGLLAMGLVWGRHRRDAVRSTGT